MILLVWDFFWFSAKKVKKTGLVQNKQISKFRPKAEKKVLGVVFCMVFAIFRVVLQRKNTETSVWNRGFIFGLDPDQIWYHFWFRKH